MARTTLNLSELQNQRYDLPRHSEDGVDLTLIRWMLSMNPAERLHTLQRTGLSIQILRALVRNR
jgi:hypothetical protein